MSIRSAVRFLIPTFGASLLLGAVPGAGTPRALPPVQFNDNLVPAGSMVAGELVVSLVAAPGDWRPLGPDHAGATMLVFGEVGHPLEDPGPLLRVPLGSRLSVNIRNATAGPIVVHGLCTRSQPVDDSLVVPAGATDTATFDADRAGTFYYWATAHNEGFERRVLDDAHLNGALIVDPAGAPPAPDRVLVIERYTADTLPTGGSDLLHDLFTINGRPWPLTERFTFNVGDSVRWRVINATNDVHPLHLHGFYYRVDSRGDFLRDTIYRPEDQRHVVTEPMWDGSTMDMAWQPDRPGGWIFHCHLNPHVARNSAMPPDTEPRAIRKAHLFTGYPEVPGPDHATTSMGGLVLGIFVRPPAGWRPDSGPRRTLRLVAQSAHGSADTSPTYWYALDEAGHATRGDSARGYGPTIVLHRGEPTRIWIVNHTPQMTQVHWHGLEIESRVDGVAGISGIPGAMEPAIMPGDSYQVLVTPPRSGSFMYHTHINDIFQQSHGFYGPLLVLDSGATRDSDRDRIFIAGNSPAGAPVLNGVHALPVIELKVGTAYRFRLMNITVTNPGLRFQLLADSLPLQWTPLAKDGYPVSRQRRTSVPARQPVNIGETFDFQLTPRHPGAAVLEVRGQGGKVAGIQPIRFVP